MQGQQPLAESAQSCEESKGKGELGLFGLSKSALIKRIQILMHEVKIYHRLQEGKNDASGPNKSKKEVESEIVIESYQQNQQTLKQKLTQVAKELTEAQKKIDQKDKEMKKLEKQIEVYLKTVEAFERMGGRTKMAKLEELNRQEKQQSQSMSTENIKLKKQLLEANNKCKILKQLNHQTQTNAAEMINRHLKQSKVIQYELQKDTRAETDKENDATQLNVVPSKQTTIELLSLKQQLRTTKQQLKASEDGKEQLRSKLNERELFYSKLMASNY